MGVWKAIAFVMVVSTLTAGSRAYADDTTDMDQLRQEVAALREEVDQLRKERDGLKAQLRKLKPDAKEAPEGALNGIQWEITALNRENVAVASTTFYAQDGKILKDGREIGSYTDAGNRARMDITGATPARVNGTYSLLRIKNDPATYSGTFKSREGFEVRVLLKALLD